MRTSALFSTKNIGVFKMYGVSTWTRGVEECKDFTDKGVTRGVEECKDFTDKGVNFSRFCADVFYGRPQTLNKGCRTIKFAKYYSIKLAQGW